MITEKQYLKQDLLQMNKNKEEWNYIDNIPSTNICFITVTAARRN